MDSKRAQYHFNQVENANQHARDTVSQVMRMLEFAASAAHDGEGLLLQYAINCLAAVDGSLITAKNHSIALYNMADTPEQEGLPF